MKDFRAIDRKLFYALMAGDFQRAEYKVIMAVLEKTIGWGKEAGAEIKMIDFESMTGLSHPAVNEAIQKLKSTKNVLNVVKPKNNKKPCIYNVNPYSVWNIKFIGKADLTTSSKAGLTTNPPETPENLTAKSGKTLPLNVENLTASGKVVEPVTPPIIDKLIDNPINTSSINKPEEEEELIKLFFHYMGRTPTLIEKTNLRNFINEFGLELTKKALKSACDKGAYSPFAFARIVAESHKENPGKHQKNNKLPKSKEYEGVAQE